MSVSRFFRCALICSLMFQVCSVHAKQYMVGPSTKSIPVYQNAASSKPFEVIGKVRVTATLQSQLRDEMIKTTRKLGGDAVIQYTVIQDATLPLVGGVKSKSTVGILVGEQTQPVAEGIIIRFVEQGGVTEITDQTQVPVLN